MQLSIPVCYKYIWCFQMDLFKTLVKTRDFFFFLQDMVLRVLRKVSKKILNIFVMYDDM